MTDTIRILLVLSVAAACLCASAGCASAPTASVSAPAPGAEPPAIAEKVVADDGTVVAKLANGLTVIVRPLRTAPVVCVRAYVRAGGLYEGRWLGCGLSHLLEHLVAKGAVHEGNGGGAARRTVGRVAEIGGQSNAYTSLGHTCYYISAAAGKTMDCIDLVADWLARPEITAEDFQREHGVVQRELELGEDKPDRQMWTAHAQNVFRTHPAATPVIGLAAPLAKVTRDDVLAYHRRMYVPQNMVLAVVGDMDPGAVLKRVRAAFAGLPRGRNPSLGLPPAPSLTGIRRVVKPNDNLTTEVLQKQGFQTIPLVHEDLHALDVLSYILSNGQASRLVRSLVREQKLVTSVSSSSWTPSWGRGIFDVSFRCAPGKADAAEKAVLAELRRVVAQGVSAEEVARAKRQKIADQVFGQQTAESIAGSLAIDLMTTGDIHFSRNYTRKIQSVAAEQVQRAAKKYFTFDRMAITRLVPAKTFSIGGAATTTAKAGGEQAFTLPNGLRVVLHPTRAVGLAAMALVTEGGVLLETDQTNGLGTLMTGLSTQGAGERSAEQIAAFFDRAGGRISGQCGNNTFYWRAAVLDDAVDAALEILADVILRPTFSKKELDILRPRLLQGIKRTDQDLLGQAFKISRGKFFTGSPYRRLATGSEDVVEAATPLEIRAYHRKVVKAGSSVLAVFGNFDAAATRKRIEHLFAKMPAGTVQVPSPPARTVAPGGELHVERTNKAGAAVIFSLPGMKITNLEDRFAITVLDTIISGYRLPAGWLHAGLRGRKLVYVVHAYNWAGLAPGAFVTYAAGQPHKAPEVVRLIRGHLARAATYLPTKEEVDRAVNTVLTAELLENQSMGALAMSAALDELYGFGHDFRKKIERHYRKVTPQEVLRVGKKYFSGPPVVVVTTPKPGAFDETNK